MTRYDERNARGQGKSSENVKEQAKTQASQVSEQAKQQAKGQIDKGRNVASSEMEKVAHAAKAAASDLRDQDREGLSQYVTEMADNMTSLAHSLRNKNVDELVHEVSNIARKNPTLFIAGSVAIGLGLSRFAKSSSQNQGRIGHDSQDMYPGYSDMDAESRGGSAWASSYAESEYSAADYSDRDFPSTGSETITGDTLPSGDNTSNPLGGKRYE